MNKVIIILLLLLIFNPQTCECLAKEVKGALSRQESQMTYLGDYRITFYCGGSCCCGQWAGSPTASGSEPIAGYTCACGSDIDFGTTLYVEGLGTYVCEDRGVESGCLDVYVNSHEDIPNWGMTYLPTYIVEK